jgi:hypothetical protein
MVPPHLVSLPLQLAVLSTRYQSRKQLQLSEGVKLPWYIIHPHDIM